MFSGNSRYIGLPIGLDRICFALGITLLVLDRRAWSGLRLLRLGQRVTVESGPDGGVARVAVPGID